MVTKILLILTQRWKNSIAELMQIGFWNNSHILLILAKKKENDNNWSRLLQEFMKNSNLRNKMAFEFFKIPFTLWLSDKNSDQIR